MGQVCHDPDQIRSSIIGPDVPDAAKVAERVNMADGMADGSDYGWGRWCSLHCDMMVTSVARTAAEDVPVEKISGGAPTVVVSRTTALAIIFRQTGQRSAVVLVKRDNRYTQVSIGSGHVADGNLPITYEWPEVPFVPDQ